MKVRARGDGRRGEKGSSRLKLPTKICTQRERERERVGRWWGWGREVERRERREALEERDAGNGREVRGEMRERAPLRLRKLLILFCYGQ